MRFFHLEFISVFGLACKTHNFYIEGDGSLTAHNCASGLAPGNTLSAMQKTIEFGLGYAELLEVMQPTRLLTIYLWEKNFADIKDMGAGSLFSDESTGEPVPTLEQAIELMHGKMKFYIEPKISALEETHKFNFIRCEWHYYPSPGLFNQLQ